MNELFDRVVCGVDDTEAGAAAARQAARLTRPAGSLVLGELSEHADLVVVGSRGLKGIRSLGSVGERIAHEARCSVLVVRPPDTRRLPP